MRKDFDAWLHESADPKNYFTEPLFDDASESSRFRHSGWRQVRKRIWESMLRTAQSPNRRRSFGECGSYSWIEQSEENSQRFRVRYNHCHDRLCTPCANARATRVREALMAQIGKNPVSFITLTLCGKSERLSDLIDRLYKHFRALRLHPFWAEKVRGGAAFLEIKYSDKARRWHPHLHIIADADFMPQGELSNVWRGISKDSFIVDIRRVGSNGDTAGYVTKYATKPLNSSFSNTPALLDEALIAFKGRRLCMCFGTWYGTKLTDAEDADLDLDETEEKWKMFRPLEDVLKEARMGIRASIDVICLAGAEARWRSALFDTS